MKTFQPISVFEKFAIVFCFSLALGSPALAQISNSFPVVTVVATQPFATAANPGVFTVFRAGNTNAALNGVWYDLGGTASNGVDYAMISPHLMTIPAGATSSNIVITPLTNPPSSIVRTVVLTLTNSPMMYPVNFGIGVPNSATVFILPAGVTNLPPNVRMVNPTNNAVFIAPAIISLIAKAADPDGSVTNVEFFADGTDLGRGLPVVLDPPGVNGMTGPVYFLNWQNVSANLYSLTAVATDNGGASATSAPVNITVLSHTNLPPIVRITSPPSGSVFRAPVNIPIYAYAADSDGPVMSMEFFAGNTSLGFGQHVAAVPPPLPPGQIQPPILVVVPTNYWELVWTNPPVGTNIALTARATDNGGTSTISSPVLVSILPSPPPPTNRPAIVSIVATDPIAIEGTNCWTWPGLVSPAATWSNWFAPNATFRPFTNCGPKAATFTVIRSGATNNDLAVAYAIGGTATNGIDYVALPGTVTIPAGERRAAITVLPLDDGPPDLTSTVILKLIGDTTGTNYLLGQPRAAAAIILDSQSPRAVTGTVPGAAFIVSAAGPDGAWFHVEFSSDMIHWTPICTNQVVNGSINFVDPDAATNPARFYRTVPEAGSPQ